MYVCKRNSAERAFRYVFCVGNWHPFMHDPPLAVEIWTPSVRRENQSEFLKFRYDCLILIGLNSESELVGCEKDCDMSVNEKYNLELSIDSLQFNQMHHVFHYSSHLLLALPVGAP